MIRINQTVLLGCAVGAFSLLSIAFADDALPPPPAPDHKVHCVLPVDVNDTSGNPNVKEMTVAECEAAGGKPEMHHPKPKD